MGSRPRRVVGNRNGRGQALCRRLPRPHPRGHRRPTWGRLSTARTPRPGALSPGTPCPGRKYPPSRGGGTARKVIGGLLTVFGVLGMLGGGALATHAYSNSQQSIPNSAYGPTLWRNETTDRLFPETVGEPPNYTYDASDKKIAQWSRMGISQDTSCSKALSGETKQTAERLGCEAVLRATYVDLTGEMVATVAIIVLPKGGTGAQEMGEFLDNQSQEDVPDAAVVPFAVPGTLAAKWQENRRNGMGGYPYGASDSFPYAVAVTTGSVDGRTSGNLPGEFGSYGANDEDKIPWMDTAHALSQTFSTHLGNLKR
jgi:hypothetical protein